jgi:hypothetical protein
MRGLDIGHAPFSLCLLVEAAMLSFYFLLSILPLLLSLVALLGYVHLNVILLVHIASTDCGVRRRRTMIPRGIILLRLLSAARNFLFYATSSLAPGPMPPGL